MGNEARRKGMNAMTESKSTEYHYILTVQVPGDDPHTVITRDGTVNVSAGGTRAACLAEIYTGASVDRMAPVIFFSLEPNEL